jgi:hypothetical protein
MKVIGITIDKQIDYLKEFTCFDFDTINQIEFVLCKSKGYEIIKENHNYIVHYNKRNDIFAAFGYIFSHLYEQTYTIKRKRAMDELGYMIDCARNAVPKIETLKLQTLNLSLMGYTYIGLYLEDVFDIEGEPLFGYMRGKYKTSEITELLEFSKLFGMQVVPYIQTLAHLNAIFKHREYNDILDINDILLVGESKTYDLIEKMIVTAKTMFNTNTINIGMDEAWMLGLGKYLSKHGFTDRMEIMITHLNKVMKICNEHEINATMWADMFFHLKSGSYLAKEETSFDDIKSLIPTNVELLYWDYYHLEKGDYDTKFKSLKTLTDNYAFAGAAWKWIGFAPFNKHSEQTMTPAIESALEFGVNHFVVTSWGDNGAEASMFSILPSLFFAAERIYNDNLGNREAFLSTLTNYNLHSWMNLDSLNQPFVAKPIKAVNPSKYLLYEDILLGDTSIVLNKNFKGYYQKVLALIEPTIHIQSRYSYIFKNLYNLAKILELKSTLSIELYEAYHKKDMDTLLDIQTTVLPEIISRIQTFMNTFRTQWYLENKFQGFEVQSYRLGGLVTRLLEIKDILKMYLDNEISTIDMLDERILNLSRIDDPYNGCVYYNQFAKYTTFGTF